MRIHEVCGQCGLTRKAVEYYEKQGLIRPGVDENGYRNYGDEDARRLREIAVLRRLDIGIPEIRDVLESPDREAALALCLQSQERRLRKASTQLECLKYLCDSGCDIGGAEKMIARKLGGGPIAERLEMAFPGAFGKLLRFHFGRFLNGAADTEDKTAAYARIEEFLDGLADMEFPADLESLLDEALGVGDDSVVQRLDDGLIAGIGDFDAFMREHRDCMEWYLKYRESPEYRNSPAHRMRQALNGFFKDSGYYEVFIPNMKILSDSYREYMGKMQEANERFLQEYPQAGNLIEG